MGTRFAVLGPLQVSDGDRLVRVGGHRQRVVLAMLLSRAGRVLSVDALIDAVWGYRPPDTAAAQVQTAVWQLRRVLGQDRILRHPHGYALRLDADGCDAEVFERLTRSARDESDPVRRSRILHSALQLWRADEAYPEFRGIEPLRTEATRLAELRLAAWEDRIGADLLCGRGADLTSEVTALAYAHPLREESTALLMRVLQASGRQPEALAAYRRFRRRLRDELGTDPSPELQALHRSMLADHAGRRPDDSRTWLPAQLPRPVPDFVGRRDEQRWLDAALLTGRTAGAPLAVICGPPGVGKTSLAVQWAHRHRHRFPDGQLYVNLRGYGGLPPLRPIGALTSMLRSLGTPAGRIPTEVDAAAALFRSWLDRRSVLILLDNAADAEQIRPLLPAASGSAVVVTSRDRLDTLTVTEGAAVLVLDGLAAPESRELFEAMVGADRVTGQSAAAAELAERCGHLPLALRIAAGNLAAHSHDRFADVLSRLDAQGVDALAGPTAVGGGVGGAFADSYRRLPADSRRLFRLLGAMPCPTVTTDAAAVLTRTSGAIARQQLDRLAAAHLIRMVGRDRYGLHDLLRRYASRLRPDAAAAGIDAPADTGASADAETDAAIDDVAAWSVHTAVSAAITLYPHFVPMALGEVLPSAARPFDSRADARAWLEAELDNLVALADRDAREQRSSPLWMVAAALPVRFWSSGHMLEWWSSCDAAARIVEHCVDPLVRAMVGRARGSLLSVVGRSVAGAGQLDAALADAVRAGWREGELLIHVHRGDLAMTHHGDLPRAARHFDVATRLADELGSLPGAVFALGNRGELALQAGRLDEAEADLSRAVRISERLGSDHWHSSLLVLRSRALTALGRCDEARACAGRAYALYHLEGSRFGQAEALNAQSAASLAAGDEAAAERQAREALEIGDGHHEIPELRAAALHELGRLRQRRGDHNGAIAVLGEGLELLRGTEEPYLTVQLTATLAASCAAAGDDARADRLTASAARISRTHGYRLPAAGSTPGPIESGSRAGG